MATDRPSAQALFCFPAGYPLSSSLQAQALSLYAANLLCRIFHVHVCVMLTSVYLSVFAVGHRTCMVALADYICQKEEL